MKTKLTWEQIKSKYASKPKQAYTHKESDIQIACVRWFNLLYAKYEGLLFSVPNGGRRNAIEAKWLKREGVVSGVADLLLFIPASGYHALCIEMKTAKGRQSPTQKTWQKKAEKQGYKYIVCRSLQEFQEEITNYLKA